MPRKIANSRVFSILIDSRNAHGLTPSFWGGVCGSVSAWNPMTIDATPARTSASARTAGATASAARERHTVSNSPAAIQPSVPHTRIAPNSFSESVRLIIAIELVSASVGAYTRQYASMSQNIVPKSVARDTTRSSTPPLNERKAMSFSEDR